MICYSCGAEIPDHSKFCPKCGKTAAKPAAQETPAAVSFSDAQKPADPERYQQLLREKARRDAEAAQPGDAVQGPQSYPGQSAAEPYAAQPDPDQGAAQPYAAQPYPGQSEVQPYADFPVGAPAAAPEKKKNWLPFLLGGVGLLAVIAIVLILVLSNSSGGSGGGGSSRDEAFSTPGVYHMKTVDGKKPLDHFKEYYEAEISEKYDSYEDFLDEEGVDEADLKDPYILTLNEDGTGSFKITFLNSIGRGTWTQEGDTVVFTNSANGSGIEFKVRGNTLVLMDEYFSDGQVEIVFAK